MRIRPLRTRAANLLFAGTLVLGAAGFVVGCGGGGGNILGNDDGGIPGVPTGQNEPVAITITTTNGTNLSTLEVGSTVTLHARPTDIIGNTVQGVKVNWAALDPEILQIVKRLSNGDLQVKGVSIGTGRITATFQSVTQTITVSVVAEGTGSTTGGETSTGTQTTTAGTQTTTAGTQTTTAGTQTTTAGTQTTTAGTQTTTAGTQTTTAGTQTTTAGTQTTTAGTQTTTAGTQTTTAGTQTTTAGTETTTASTTGPPPPPF